MKNETLIIMPEMYKEAFTAEQYAAIKKRLLYMAPALFGLEDYTTPFVEVVSNPEWLPDLLKCKDDAEKILDFTEVADRAQWVIALYDWRSREHDHATMTSIKFDICHILHDTLETFRIIESTMALTITENKIIDEYLKKEDRTACTSDSACSIEEDLF